MKKDKKLMRIVSAIILIGDMLFKIFIIVICFAFYTIELSELGYRLIVPFLTILGISFYASSLGIAYLIEVMIHDRKKIK